MPKDFIAWFERTHDSKAGEGIAALKDLIKLRRAELEQLDSIDGMQKLVQQHAGERNMPEIVDAFSAARAEWDELSPDEQKAAAVPSADAPIPGPPLEDAKKQDAQTAPAPTGWLATLLGYGGAFGVALFTAFLLVMFAIALFDDELLRSLADVAVSRGLITFFFTIGTIGIAVLMIAGLFLSGVDKEAVLKQRFDGGKEILTALIAILGTVVGFYFGSQSSERADARVELQPIAVSNAEPGPAETIQISTLASGGDAPYRYTIDFQWPEADADLAKELPDITNKESPSGFIAEHISIPKTAAGRSIPYVLLITDANNRAISMTGEKLVVKGGTEAASAASGAASDQPPQ